MHGVIIVPDGLVVGVEQESEHRDLSDEGHARLVGDLIRSRYELGPISSAEVAL
jgi:hypothetical protein